MFFEREAWLGQAERDLGNSAQLLEMAMVIMIFSLSIGTAKGKQLPSSSSVITHVSGQ
jgi:hypothetical protein